MFTKKKKTTLGFLILGLFVLLFGVMDNSGFIKLQHENIVYASDIDEPVGKVIPDSEAVDEPVGKVISDDEEPYESIGKASGYVDSMEDTQTTEEADVSEDEASEAEDEGMSMGMCILRIILAIVVMGIGIITSLIVFAEPIAGVGVDMAVIFICTVLIGVDRLQDWLKLDSESILMLFPVFLVALIICCAVDAGVPAGILYLIQMGLLSIAVSGMLSGEVINTWIMKVGAPIGVTSGAIIAVFIAAFVFGPMAFLWLIIKLFID